MEELVINFFEDIREVVIIYIKDFKRWELFCYEKNGLMNILGKSIRNSINIWRV